MATRFGRLAHSLERTLPGFPFDAILPWRRRAVRVGGTIPAGDGAIRVLIGPENSAGQGEAWRRALDRLPGVTATSFMIRPDGDRWGFPANHIIAAADAAHLPWQRAQWREVDRFTHVILESGRPLFGDERANVEDQVRRLLGRGLRVALLWHGSDIRDPDAHSAREAFSPFGQLDPRLAAALGARAARNRALAHALRLPEFVSTPDLLVDAPAATWLPVVVDIDVWSSASAPAPLQRQRPVVIHAPSNGPMKGSDLIRTVLHRLHAEGLLDYREIAGVPSTGMPALVSSADIVLDQFALGSFGVASVEALAAGRIVVGHVSTANRAVVASVTGRDLPIVQATPETLESTLRAVIAEPDRSRDVAARGPAYARHVHDGGLSARVLETFLGVSTDQVSTGGRGKMDGCPRQPMEGENG